MKKTNLKVWTDLDEALKFINGLDNADIFYSEVPGGYVAYLKLGDLPKLYYAETPGESVWVSLNELPLPEIVKYKLTYK